jgi:transcriptional regulator with XRE-family HTH domain
MTTQAWSSFSDLLRTYRKHKQWTQERLAEYLGFSYETISAWERGLRHPNRHEIPRLATLLAVEADVLAQCIEADRTHSKQKTLANVVPDPLPEPLLSHLPAELHAHWQTLQQVDPSRRDFFLHVLVMVSTAMATLPHEPLSPYSLERLADVLAHGKRLDEATLADLEAIATQYWNLFRRTLVRTDLLSGVLGFLDTITQLLHDLLAPQARQRLCVIASDVTHILGKIFFDMHLYDEAEIYYQSSLSFAQQGGSDLLWTVGLKQMGFLSIHKGKAQQALPLLAEAQQTVLRSGIPFTKLPWLALVEAEARALVGDLKSCEQALGRAEQLIGPCEHGQNKEIVQYGETGPNGDVRFQQSRWLAYKGVCYLRLGQASVAQSALEESLTLLDVNYPATLLYYGSIISTDLGGACIQQGNLEQACHYAQQALAKVEHIRSAFALQRVLTLRHDLEPWQHEQVVKQLDEQIAVVKKAVG